MDEPTAADSIVRPFHAKYFPAFPTYVRNEPDMDTIVSVVDSAWNELLPTTYLIARDGRVAQRIQDRRTPEEFRTLLQPLLEAR